MVGILNKNFTSVFTVENTPTVPKSPVLPRGIEPLEKGAIKEQEFQKYLDKVYISKSTGPDNLTPRLLKKLKQQIVQLLTSIFNRSIQRNKVPEDWKLVKLNPIFKKRR